MIPCQKTCSDYCSGCHKSCVYWSQFQSRMREERQAKKAYLKYYHELCGVLTRQFRTLGAC